MQKFFLGIFFIFLACGAKEPEQPAIQYEMVGGPATTTPLWSRQAEELANGKVVTLQVGEKYLHLAMVDLPIKKGVRYLMKPVKEVLSLEDSPQHFEVQVTSMGIFFMPVGHGKPGSRTMPGFGPFKVVPVDQKPPSLKQQVYLQNALDPATPQYVQIDEKGTDSRSATLENATIFCIKVE